MYTTSKCGKPFLDYNTNYRGHFIAMNYFMLKNDPMRFWFHLRCGMAPSKVNASTPMMNRIRDEYATDYEFQLIRTLQRDTVAKREDSRRQAKEKGSWKKVNYDKFSISYAHVNRLKIGFEEWWKGVTGKDKSRSEMAMAHRKEYITEKGITEDDIIKSYETYIAEQKQRVIDKNMKKSL